MTVTTTDYESYRLVKVSGFLDGHTRESDELIAFIDDASREIETHQVLDLSSVEYVNSSVLGSFVRFLAEAQKQDLQVVILNPPPSVENVLTLTGLSHVLPVVQCEAEIADCLGASAEHRVADKNVNYEALAEEIDSIVLHGEDVGGDGELHRLLEEE